MGESEFYITLPSNANLNEYPDNRPSNFKVNLSRKHELNVGVWEMALTEIQFTRNWRYKTPEFDLVAWVGMYDRETNLHKARPRRHVMSEQEKRYLDIDEMGFTLPIYITAYIKFPAHHWTSEHELGDELALRLRTALNVNIQAHNLSTLKKLRYERDSETNTVEFKTNEDDQILGFTTEHDNVMSILGLTPVNESAILEAKGSKVKAYGFSPSWQRIRGGFPALEVMFLYSSVCEEQHIGDRVGNLLKAVPVTVEENKRQCERYSPPTYVRLRPSTLDSIDIRMLDKAGVEVPFVDVINNVAVLQLHVRKRRRRLCDHV